MNTQRELARRGGRTGEGNLLLRTPISRRPAKNSVVIKLATVTTVTAIFAGVRAGAKAVFSQGGPGAGLESVARHAGMGIGTLSRHFPTREARYEAVYRREVEQLVELAKHLETNIAPVEAPRRWLRAGVEFMATKKGMAAALAMAAHCSSAGCGSPECAATGEMRRERPSELS
jgi:AcrR family transcriptional regulator